MGYVDAAPPGYGAGIGRECFGLVQVRLVEGRACTIAVALVFSLIWAWQRSWD